ncbi:hypothetical protein Pmani_026810, partial [Petrolisthes manimaculis]
VDNGGMVMVNFVIDFLIPDHENASISDVAVIYFIYYHPPSTSVPPPHHHHCSSISQPPSLNLHLSSSISQPPSTTTTTVPPSHNLHLSTSISHPPSLNLHPPPPPLFLHPPPPLFLHLSSSIHLSSSTSHPPPPSSSIALGLDDTSKYPYLLAELLLDETWSDEDLRKLVGLNIVRVMKQVEQVRDSLIEESPLDQPIPPEDLHDHLACVNPWRQSVCVSAPLY